jgi:hypothetical protein
VTAGKFHRLCLFTELKPAAKCTVARWGREQRWKCRFYWQANDRMLRGRLVKANVLARLSTSLLDVPLRRGTDEHYCTIRRCLANSGGRSSP